MSAEIKNITQIGIVTGDLYAMVDRYQKLYGIGPWEIRDGKKGFKDEAEDLMVYGKRQDFKVSLALCMAGNVQLELIQPLVQRLRQTPEGARRGPYSPYLHPYRQPGVPRDYGRAGNCQCDEGTCGRSGDV